MNVGCYCRLQPAVKRCLKTSQPNVHCPALNLSCRLTKGRYSSPAACRPVLLETITITNRVLCFYLGSMHCLSDLSAQDASSSV